MNPDIVLAKTETGKEEIAMRRVIPLELRRALILVDGHSTLLELLKKGEGLPYFADSLKMLEQMALIAPSDLTVAVVAKSPPSLLEPAAQPASDGVAAKVQLVLLANNLLGAQAGKVIKKIEESADTKEALISAIDGCGKVIRLVIDEEKADLFLLSAKDILSRNSQC